MIRDLVDIMKGNTADDFSGDREIVEKVKLHDLDMVLHYDTGKAVLVSDTGEEKRAVWLPKSQIELTRKDKQSNAIKSDGQRVVLPVVTVTVPLWLAKDKGLI